MLTLIPEQASPRDPTNQSPCKQFQEELKLAQ